MQVVLRAKCVHEVVALVRVEGVTKRAVSVYALLTNRHWPQQSPTSDHESTFIILVKLVAVDAIALASVEWVLAWVV